MGLVQLWTNIAEPGPGTRAAVLAPFDVLLDVVKQNLVIQLLHATLIWYL